MLSKQIHRTKDYRLHAQVFINTVNVVISRCCFAENDTDFFIRACARAARLFFHARPIKFLIYGVVVAVPVVAAKTPY